LYLAVADIATRPGAQAAPAAAAPNDSPVFLRGRFARGAKVARPEVATARAKPLG